MPGDNEKKVVLTEISDIKEVLNSFLGKLADALSTKTLNKTFQNVYDLAAQTTREIGAGGESADAIRKSIAGSVAGIQKLGYSAEDAVKKAKETAVELSQTTGKNTQYNDELFGKLISSSNLTGKSVKELSGSYTNIGYSLESVSEKTAKVFDIARANGLNGKLVSDQMLNNISAMDKYTFQGGIDGLSKMAAQSVQMRVEMSSTLSLADKLLDPEKAIDMAATLQRLGVVQSDLLDPIRLMNLSQNDPAELQRQIGEMTKEFVKLNKETGQMEILPGGRERLRAIGRELDIPYEQLTNMARASSEIGSKLSNIKFPDMATEEQKTLIANMSRLNDKNEFVISVNGVDENLDDFIANSTKNGELSNDMLKKLEPKTTEQLAQEQLTQLQLINTTIGTIGVSRGLAQAVSSPTIEASKMSQAFNESVANILREIAGGSTRDITTKRNLFNPMSDEGDNEMGNMIKMFKESIFDLPKGYEQANVEIKKLPEPFDNVIGELTKKLGLLSQGIGGVLSEITKKVKIQPGNDFIRTEDGDIDFFEKDTIIAGTGLNDIAKMIKGGNPIDIDFTQMISKGLNMPTKELENMSKNSSTKESSNENKVVIEVRVSTSNDNINPDLNQKIVDVVTQAFKDDMGLKQVVATSIKDVATIGSRPY
jgi:hypothetical protein